MKTTRLQKQYGKQQDKFFEIYLYISYKWINIKQKYKTSIKSKVKTNYFKNEQQKYWVDFSNNS